MYLRYGRYKIPDKAWYWGVDEIKHDMQLESNTQKWQPLVRLVVATAVFMWLW